MSIAYEVAVRNDSTQLSNLEVVKGVQAVNRQMRYDFAPIWGADLTVEYDARPEKFDWLVSIVDDSTVAGAAGWHSIDDQGRVISEVAINQPFPWTAVLSHEVLEMAANESVAKMAINWRDGLLYALEVCDPVQARTYNIDGIVVSDFVTPDWFANRAAPNSTAFKTRGLAPFEIGRGGYAIRWDQQFNDQTVFGSAEVLPGHFRTEVAQLTPMIMRNHIGA